MAAASSLDDVDDDVMRALAKRGKRYVVFELSARNQDRMYLTAEGLAETEAVGDFPEEPTVEQVVDRYVDAVDQYIGKGPIGDVVANSTAVEDLFDDHGDLADEIVDEWGDE